MTITAKSIAALFGLYLFFLLIQTPAQYLTSYLSRAATGVSFRDAAGTVVKGSVDVSISGIGLGAVTWRLAPLALLKGCAEFLLEPQGDAAAVQGRGAMGLCLTRRAYVKRVALKSRLDGIQLNLPLGALSARGELQADLPLIEVSKDRYHAARGTLTWRSASLNVPDRLDLGTVTATLSSEEGALVASVRNEPGELAVEGELKLLAGGSYSVRGLLSPRTARIERLLSAVLNADPRGRYPVRYRGAL